jgi:signal transduction histidine kinase
VNDQKCKVDYEQFIPRETGFIFKFEKKDNTFIHTFIEGKLLGKMGLCPELIEGKTLFEFFPAEHALRKAAFYEKAWNGEHVNYEGSIGGIHYLAVLNPVLQNGVTVEVIGTSIDITKEKTREKQVQQMEKLSVVGELAAGIAHEIRNPLTSLKGFAKIIKESVSDQTLLPYLDIMLDEMDRINEIVNEFMFIAKPSEHVNFQQTNFNKLLQECIHFMAPQANLKSIEIELNSDSEVFLNCDRKQMKQVLINLLQNSIEATEDNGHFIEVRLEEMGTDSVSVTIIDKGCGIKNSRFNRLFEPFYSTKEKGTGLGLITCKRIIDLHQGRIDIKSKLGEGTTIRICLPRLLDGKS